MNSIKHFTLKQAIKREDHDDHLNDEERKLFLTDRGIEFNENNFNELYCDIVIG